ncbi:hypothetical protein HJC23_007227 [Cyclotella cryptica]|uniref:Uncharacterized protein n=1 Tax=Cyclotella cryptica TaxID=29204 RepID=A0ABD3QQR8_9STRA|eukprot:CCRYP_003515-RA/>CCRYP_003515-RA protein AED:0.05 eAED:0.05 QI:0/-1/0/1/-1/1/1/0/344
MSVCFRSKKMRIYEDDGDGIRPTNLNPQVPWINNTLYSNKTHDSTMTIDDNNNLHQPLLADDNREPVLETNTKSDDDVASPLVLTSGASTDLENATTSPRRCCRCAVNCFTWLSQNKWLTYIVLFSFLTWAAFILSLYVTYSCDIILVRWNANSLNLSVSGVGIFRFQQRTRNVPRNRNEINCVEYGSYNLHAEIQKIEDFFPVDKKLRVLSVLAPTLAGVVFLGIMGLMVLASLYPDKFMNRLTNREYPWKSLSISYVLGGVILIAAGTLELIVVLDLLNIANPVNDIHESPICNSAYSTCRLGGGGKVAITASSFCYGAALIALAAACITVGSKFKESRGRR